MRSGSMADRRGELEQLSTQLLDQRLQEQLQNAGGDPDEVNLILDILKKREQDMPVPLSLREIPAWERYQARTKSRAGTSPGRRKWILRAASIVLVVFVLFASVSNQAAAEPFWQRIARWTDSVFAFFSPDAPTQPIEKYEFQTENPGLRQVYDEITGLGVTEPVVPMWLPDGYTLSYCRKTIAAKKTTVVSVFQNGGKVINYNVAVYSEELSNQYQKDETEAKVFEHYGTEYHIVQNNTMWVVVWTIRNIECSISVDCQEDEVYRMIRSIYEKEEA